MPFMNLTESSVLNFRASSIASLITTAGGVSLLRSSSHAAMRRIKRSMTAMRSGRQRSADYLDYEPRLFTMTWKVVAVKDPGFVEGTE